VANSLQKPEISLPEPDLSEIAAIALHCKKRLAYLCHILHGYQYLTRFPVYPKIDKEMR